MKFILNNGKSLRILPEGGIFSFCFSCERRPPLLLFLVSVNSGGAISVFLNQQLYLSGSKLENATTCRSVILIRQA